MVEGANPNNSVIWQAHNSPSLRASSTRMRFSSASALVILIKSRMECFYVLFYISPLNEVSCFLDRVSRSYRVLCAPVREAPPVHGATVGIATARQASAARASGFSSLMRDGLKALSG